MTNQHNPSLVGIFDTTQAHRRAHGCGAYPFNDGAGLTAIAAQHQPKRILELGCALGYTACCMAAGSSAAVVDTIEFDAGHVFLAREQIKKNGFESRITVHQGKFEDVLQNFHEHFDMILFDGFEPKLELIVSLRDRLNIGGILVCANIGLARADAKPLKHILFDATHWRSEMALEKGQTAVCVKL